MVSIDPAVEAEFRRGRDIWSTAREPVAQCSVHAMFGEVPGLRSQCVAGDIPGTRRGSVPLASMTDVAEHMAMARAAATNRKRGYTIRNYEEMCASSGFVAFPVSGESLVAYTVGLTKKALKYETVTDYVGTIKLESRLLSDYELSQMENERVRLALQASKRLLSNRSTKRTVTLDIDQVGLLAHLVPESGRARSTVAYLVGTMGLMRLKEVVSLKFSDITLGADGDYVAIKIRHSKTDQSGDGATVYVGCVSFPHHRRCEEHACALHRLVRMLATLKDSEREGRLFGATYTQLRKDINSLVTAVFSGKVDEGDEVGRKTSHSMRRTGVRLLVDANVRLEAIADYGRWKDVRTVQNNYMRDFSGRLGREKIYSSRMMHAH
ncbi:conserved hypothetical protein [Perkinsus marinus ATCC 50983]|uniref:Uncharacterized protein n=1 Tax=Perkinsus marinus (strain ATCC 50983 / TXsc) TaxID=423536 RepID=C5KF56_PERM5|nr:conserved hypothetical protein [Perkinsus marinus ATCC 50983]EER16857.1 conserved hypothetical protein [Perkinsus marinus ATCC 50983]|eukprot:XP_002785061.1 conserved hypothetical protein [Perkinsus marinus ATCC 50983]